MDTQEVYVVNQLDLSKLETAISEVNNNLICLAGKLDWIYSIIFWVVVLGFGCLVLVMMYQLLNKFMRV